MGRWSRPRPRRRAVAGMLVMLVVGVLAIALAPGATAETAPTITFRSTGDPTVCTSRPDRSSMTLLVGTGLTLVNLTGTSALVDTGTKKARGLDDGDGIIVHLTVGEHSVRMVPDCQVSGEIAPAMVTVVERADGSTSAGAVASGGLRAGQSGPAGAPGPGGPAASGSPLPGSSGGLPSAPPSGGPAAGGFGEPSSSPGPTEDGFSDPFSTGRGGEQSIRLLAVVALICIFGVTVGIIRAIRAQRARSVVERVP